MKNKANKINHCRFFSPLTHLKHQTKAKTQITKLLCAGGSQRGWLLHADQGKELLTTSNTFTVCLMSADCRHPEKALDMRLLTLAQNGCLEKQIHNYTQHDQHRHTGTARSRKCLNVPAILHVCMNSHTHTQTPTRSPTLDPWWGIPH